jgi:hypothetical protein
VLLLALAARLATTPGRRTAAFRLLIASLAVTMAADTLFSVLTLSGASAAVTDGMYLAAYLLLGASGLHPSMAGLSEPSRRRQARLGRGRCARTASDSPSRSSAANSSTTALSAASPPGWRPGGSVECVFESMAATYQATTRRQAQNQICGQPFGPAPLSDQGQRSGRSFNACLLSRGPPCQAPAWGPNGPTHHAPGERMGPERPDPSCASRQDGA